LSDFVGCLCRKCLKFDKVSDEVSDKGPKIDALGTNGQGEIVDPDAKKYNRLECETISATETSVLK
jgi:hypothetical protein